MGRSLLVAIAFCAMPALAIGCEQMLGLDGERVLRQDFQHEGDQGVPKQDDHPEQSSAHGLQGCPEGKKNCNGTCVDLDLPQYGCDSPSCTPCSLPFARSTKCVEGKCEVATCVEGRQKCSNDPGGGCESDLLSPDTCGKCWVKCSDKTPLCGAPFGGEIRCVPDCGDLTQCGSSCVDTTKTVTACGGCGNVCPSAPNADPVCNAKQCGIACRDNFGDCNGDSKDGCEALPIFYKDGDVDSWGVTSDTVASCTQPAGYVGKGGDCLDTDKNVHPDQTDYFVVPFAGPSGPSFDYDCSGTESEKPGFPHYTSCGASTCGLPFWSEGASRTGAGVDPYCGSTKGVSCASVSGGACTPASYTAPALPCH